MSAYGRIAECRSCGAPIRFVRLNTGNVIPVNPQPGETGNVLAESLSYGAYARLEGWVESAAHPARPGMLRFVPHYATCEEAPRRTEHKPPTQPEPTLFD